jgi:hypothetical protein
MMAAFWSVSVCCAVGALCANEGVATPRLAIANAKAEIAVLVTRMGKLRIDRLGELYQRLHFGEYANFPLIE